MALQINSELTLTTGLVVASGSYVKIGISLPERDTDSAVITLGIYKDLTSYNENKERVLNIENLPISFFAIQDENIVNPLYVHNLAINHIASNLGINNSLIDILL